jgi:hypothetical protein
MAQKEVKYVLVFSTREKPEEAPQTVYLTVNG